MMEPMMEQATAYLFVFSSPFFLGSSSSPMAILLLFSLHLAGKYKLVSLIRRFRPVGAPPSYRQAATSA